MNIKVIFSINSLKDEIFSFFPSFNIYFLLQQWRKKIDNNVLKKYLETISPYATFYNTSEDILLLGFSKDSVSEDTSWTLFVIKSKENIYCRYSQLLPYNVTGFNNFLDDSSKLIYYEGFNFEIDKNKWNIIVNLSEINKYLVKDSVRYTGCFIGPDIRPIMDQR